VPFSLMYFVQFEWKIRRASAYVQAYIFFSVYTRSSALTERPCDTSCHWIFC